MGCNRCGKRLEANKTIVLNGNRDSEEICVDCFNEGIEEILGIKTGNLIVKQITINDKIGNSYTFDIIKMIIPTGISLQAIELKEIEEEGYEFHVLGVI